MEKRKPWKVLLGNFIFLWLLFFSFSFPTAALERYNYLEKGSDSLPIEWILEKQDGLKLTVVRPGETHITCNDLSCSTFQWEMRRLEENTCIVAKREKGNIIILGRDKGKAIYKKISIDEAPWYQAISLSMRPFIVSEATTVEFWTVRPDNLTPYKIKARKDVIETLAIGGKEFAARKVIVSLTGLMERLWNCCYWFRKEDGLFLKYEGRDGPPKYDYKIITYIGKK